jgi:hypothetical protein
LAEFFIKFKEQISFYLTLEEQKQILFKHLKEKTNKRAFFSGRRIVFTIAHETKKKNSIFHSRQK